MNFHIDGSGAQKLSSVPTRIVPEENRFLPMTGQCMRSVGQGAPSNVFRH
jgi:hypothetical protein